jgi:hypothetical protein
MMNGDIPSLGAGLSSSGAQNPLNLGQAVIVSLSPQVLALAQKPENNGRILAEVVSQEHNQVTLKTPEGQIVIKTDAQLSPGQAVMMRLDTSHQQARLLNPVPQFQAPQIDQTAPAQGDYVVRMTPNVEAAQEAEALPQKNWRGQFLPADLPKEAVDLIRFLQAVYRPGSASNQQNLPLSVTEGVAKLVVFTQMLQQMGRLAQSFDPRMFFAAIPPEELTDERSMLQALQKATAAMLPSAQKAGEQAGQWLKNTLPSSVMGQLNQLGDVFQKAGAALSPLLPQAGATADTGAAIPVQVHALPEGLTLLQAWHAVLQSPDKSPAPQAPYVLMQMLGIQRPGQDMAPLQTMLPQLQQSGDLTVMPTVVLPGATRESPLLLSPFGLLFSLPNQTISGRGPLLPGTVIFWSPMINPALQNAVPSTIVPADMMALWPQKLDGGGIVGESDWMALTQMLGTGLDATIRDLIPNMANPARLSAVTTLLLHAMKFNSVTAWLGDKTIERLRDGGRQDLLARLVSDFAQMSTRSMDMPAGTDMQRFTLPFLLHEQMAKMVWHVKRDYPDGHDDYSDDQQRKFHARTHFTVDVPTARYGDFRIDGMVWKHTLDLNIQTHLPLDETMRNGIRERFKTALDITGYRGQVIFSDQALEKA